MYIVLWALKNLLRNPKRALKNIGFISVCLVFSILGLAFLRGTNDQMKKSLISSFGDITITERKLLSGLKDAKDYIVNNYGSKIESMHEVLITEAEMLGAGTWTSVNLVGVSAEYFHIFQNSQAWEGMEPELLGEQQVCISAGLKEKLGITDDDIITLRTGSSTVMVNTMSAEVIGSFYGSELIYDSSVIIPIDDARSLMMVEPDISSAIYIFLKPGLDRLDMENMYSDISVKFFRDAITETTLLYPEDNDIYTIFQNYRLLLVTSFTLFYILACVILSFSSRNNFYLYYRARRNELASLLTFGMSKRKIITVAVFEAIFLFIVALAISGIMSFIINMLARKISLGTPKLKDLIIFFGGPGLALNWSGISMFIAIFFLFIVVLWSGAAGVKMFIKQEIRGITSDVL